MNKTALSYWFPIIESAGLPVPKTKILRMPEEVAKEIWGIFDGIEPKGLVQPFFDEIDIAANAYGYPCFLRTDLTSGKHFWKDTCFLESAKDIASHVFRIAEFSELADLIGLDWNTWIVRELLPTIPLGVCTKYGNMPICQEFRYFVEDGTVKCHHPYWPLWTLEEGKPDKKIDYDSFCEIENEQELSVIASKAGAVVGGAWSVDLLKTKRGWYLTDMAETSKSFHWEGCPNNPKKVGDE